MKSPGVVDAVLVQDERIRNSADLQQPMPVCRVPSKARDFESEDDTRPAHAHFHDEPLKAVAVGRRRTRLAQIVVYRDDLIILPAERDGAFPERVLAGGTLGMLQRLARGGLTDVEKGAALELAGSQLLARFNAHG